jgi:hypothetical protein
MAWPLFATTALSSSIKVEMSRATGIVDALYLIVGFLGAGSA